MQTRVVVGQPWDVEADVLALPIPSDASLPAPVVEIDRRLDGALSAYRTVGELQGQAVVVGDAPGSRDRRRPGSWPWVSVRRPHSTG